MRVFGCRAYGYVNKDERKKLKSRAKEAMFVGYPCDRRGYKLLDLKTLRAIYSHTVGFDENAFVELPTPDQIRRSRKEHRTERQNKRVRSVNESLANESSSCNHVAELNKFILPEDYIMESLVSVPRSSLSDLRLINAEERDKDVGRKQTEDTAQIHLVAGGGGATVLDGALDGRTTESSGEALGGRFRPATKSGKEPEAVQ